MNRELIQLAELSQKHSFVFELIVGRKQRCASLLFFDDSGVLGYYFVTEESEDVFSSFLKEIFSNDRKKVCFGMRQVLQAGLAFKGYCDIIDVGLFFEGDRLQNIGNSVLREEDIKEFNEMSRKMSAHIKACEIAQIDIDEHGMCNAIPSKIVIAYHRAMAVMVLALYRKIRQEDMDLYEDDFGFFASLCRLEQNGIHVNLDAAPVSISMADRRFLEDIRKHTDSEGLLRVRFAPRSTKTDRLTIEKGSFNFMNMPSTAARSVIESRFDGGQIVSFDFNAIDYRCLIASIDDLWLKSQYDSGSDFHSRTVELVMGQGSASPERRKIVKLFTYVVMYGGAEGTLQNLGLSKEKVGILFRRLRNLLSPVEDYSNRLYSESVSQGFIQIPDGKKIPLEGHERPSYVLSIYAQACSSRVFAEAVRSVDIVLTDQRSVGIFTVHDEYVLDLHPEEIYLVDRVREALENSGVVVFGNRFMVDVTRGSNYWEVT